MTCWSPWGDNASVNAGIDRHLAAGAWAHTRPQNGHWPARNMRLPPDAARASAPQPAPVTKRQERTVHEYTARTIHEDRMAQFEREADASLLAWKARQGQPRRGLRSRIRWTTPDASLTPGAAWLS